MYEHTLPIQFISEEPAVQSKPIDISNLLVKEYRFWNVWLDRQTETERMKIINQADNLANALLQGKKAAIITYPGELIFPVYGSATNDTKEWVISEAGKNIVVQRKHRWFASENFLQTIEKQFSCLEGSADQGIAAFGGLLRFATSRALIYDHVPAGDAVTPLIRERVPLVRLSGDFIRRAPAGADVHASTEHEHVGRFHGRFGNGMFLANAGAVR